MRFAHAFNAAKKSILKINKQNVAYFFPAPALSHSKDHQAIKYPLHIYIYMYCFHRVYRYRATTFLAKR